MPATRPATVSTRTVTVRELTFGEVRDWMTAVESGEQRDALHALALDDCGLDDLARMSDISTADLEACAPSDLAELIKVCKELNPHFFKVRAALSGVARLMLAEVAVRAATSTAPPASSSPPDMSMSGPIPGAPT